MPKTGIFCHTRPIARSVLSGSGPLPSPVSGSCVVITQRVQGLTTRKVSPPIRKVRQPSSAKASPTPSITRLGRNRAIVTGVSSCRLRAASESVVVTSSGKPSAKPTMSPLWP